MRPLAEALRGKRLLVTGATGFLGKVYVSRLLAIAPEVGAIYCLARPGQGKTGAERIDEEVRRSPALAQLPEALRRRAIHAIDGDASLDRFGLSEEAFAALARGIDGVVHVAGVVDFSPPLTSALSVNVYGTRGAIALARAARAPLLHTSTCFVSGSREGVIDDRAELGDYPLRDPLRDEVGPEADSLFSAEREIELCERLCEHCDREAKDPAVIARYAREGRTLREARGEADRHARRRLRDLGRERARSFGFPNTYTYSKALAEQLVLASRASGAIQATIVRPAILESALRDPEPGWNQGANTTAPLVYMIHRGQRFFPLRKDGFLDILPIDMCAGSMVAITAALLEGEAEGCYQLGSGDTNPAANPRLLELTALRYRNRAPKDQPAALALARQRYLEALDVPLAAYRRFSLPALGKLVGAARSLIDRLAPEPRPQAHGNGGGSGNGGSGVRPGHAAGHASGHAAALTGATGATGEADGAVVAGGPDAPAVLTLAGARRALRSLRGQLDHADKGIRKAASMIEEYLPFILGPRAVYATGRMRALRGRLDAADRDATAFEPERIDWRRYWLEVHLPGLERHVYPTFDAMVVRERRGSGGHGGRSEGGSGARERSSQPGAGAARGDRAARADRAATAASAHVWTGGPSRPAARDALALLVERVASAPGAPLLEAWTGEQVLARVHALAARLGARGIGAGDRVALYADNGPEWVVGWFGIVAQGATAVPLDPTLAARDVQALCLAARARGLLASPKRRAALAAAAPAAPPAAASALPFSACPLLALEDLAAPPRPGELDEFAPAALDPEQPASLLFTSGTTGAHKGVLLPHRALTSQVAALGELFELGPDDAILSVLPLYHAFEFTCGMLLPLASGARLHFAAEPAPAAIREGLARVRPTALIAVPALLEAFLRSIRTEIGKRGPLAAAAFERALAWHARFRDASANNWGPRLFRPAHQAFGGRLRFLVSGGAALPRATFEAFRGLGFDLYEGYGLTEAGPVVACGRPGRRPRAGSVGEPIPGVQVRLLDLAADGTGELAIRGPGVMLGYDGDEAATRAVLDAEGWLRTGDLARLDRRGRIAISGRAKDAIVDHAGNTVYPDEIEELYAAVEDVLELAVSRVRLEPTKEVPGALVRLADGADRALVLERFREVDDTLPFPKRLKVVRFTDRALPRTATRKAKRVEVTKLLEERLEAERALERAQGAERREAAAGDPAAAALEAARALVAEVAGIDGARLRAESRLQEDAGLDSLQLAELAERLGRAAPGGAGAASGGRGGNGTGAHAGVGAGAEAGATGLGGLRTVGDLAARLAARNGAGSGNGSGNGDGGIGMGAAHRSDGTAAAPRQAPSRGGLALPAPLQAAGNALLTFLQKRAYEGPLRVEVSGREHIPWHTAVLVVANHASHLDVGLVKHALGEYGRHASSLGARDYFFQSPLSRLYFESFTEVVPVDRDDPSRERLADVVAKLQGGHTVILFPEGTRSTTGRIGRFRPGLGYLVQKARVGVLPIYLAGTHEALPKGALVPRRRDLGARIGRYIPPDELSRLGEGLSRHQAYRAMAEAVRQELAALGRAAGAEVELEPEPLAGAGPGAARGDDEDAGGAALLLGGEAEADDAARGSASGGAHSLGPAAAGADVAGLGTGAGAGTGPGRLERLLASLPARFKKGAVERPLRIYVKVGEGDSERWTLRLEPGSLTVIPGKGDAPADCVVKAEARVLERLLAEGELPGLDDILAGRFKTNDPDALRTLVEALGLGAAQGA